METSVTGNRMQRFVPLASILGAAITALSMIFGVLTYRRTIEVQRQGNAVAILQEYLTLSVEHPDLASRTADQPVDDRYRWFATRALFTAETLWRLVGQDRRWNSTIELLLRQHRDFLTLGRPDCDVFDPGFLQFMRDHYPGLTCTTK
jgi:hypothetical protein